MTGTRLNQTARKNAENSGDARKKGNDEKERGESFIRRTKIRAMVAAPPLASGRSEPQLGGIPETFSAEKEGREVKNPHYL